MCLKADVQVTASAIKPSFLITSAIKSALLGQPNEFNLDLASDPKTNPTCIHDQIEPLTSACNTYYTQFENKSIQKANMS